VFVIAITLEVLEFSSGGGNLFGYLFIGRTAGIVTAGHGRFHRNFIDILSEFRRKFAVFRQR